MSESTYVVFCTVPSEEVATALANRVVEDCLAACVNVVGPVRSIYRWENKVCEDTEHLAIIKTSADRLDALRERLVELHPYQCPEVLALPVKHGHADYLRWIVASTRGA